MYLRVLIKLLKCYVKEFFLKNRDIEWSRRGIGITLAVTLLGGTILGQMTVGWLYPEAISYTFTVTANAERETTEEEPVEEYDPCELRDVVYDGEIVGNEVATPLSVVIEKTFPEEPKIALAIAKAESGMRVDAVNVNSNGTRDAGLFQINDIHGYSLETRLDPIENVKIARKIYERDGWTAWSAYLNKSYMKFL